MKTLYIVSLVACLFLGAAMFYFMEEASSLRWQMWDEWDYGNYFGDAYYAQRDLTTLAGGVCLLFITFYILLYSFTLKHIKTMTAKVMSILGLSFSGLAFLVCLVPVFDPGSVTFDEFAGVPLVYDLIMLAFCIVNLVQAFRNSVSRNDEIIDDVM